jgi:hypothetical protein
MYIHVCDACSKVYGVASQEYTPPLTGGRNHSLISLKLQVGKGIYYALYYTIHYISLYWVHSLISLKLQVGIGTTIELGQLAS